MDAKQIFLALQRVIEKIWNLSKLPLVIDALLKIHI